MSDIEPVEEAEPQRRSMKALVLSFFSNPVGVASGWVFGLVGVALSIIFYLRPAEHRELCYLVHPEKTVIVQEGKLSRLSVTLDGLDFDR